MAKKSKFYPNMLLRVENDFNRWNLGWLSASEHDLFMSICVKMQNKGTRTVYFSVHDLRTMMQIPSNLSSKRFVERLQKACEKLKAAFCVVKSSTNSSFSIFSLFDAFEYNDIKQTLSVCVNEKYAYILNNVITRYTELDVAEILELKSKHSKNLYRFLSQYNTGFFKVTVEEFIERFGLTGNEYQSAKKLSEKVINPAVDELKPFFPGLKCTPVKAHTKGAPITGFEFTYSAKKKIQLRAEQFKLLGMSETDASIELRNAFVNV